MLGVILIFVIITTAIMVPITLALCKAAKKADEALEHPERINLKGD